MMLVIEVLKYFQVRRVVIHGYFELVSKQMQSEYQARHHRMRSYRNVSQDLIECFEELNFNLIPSLQNCRVDYLATSTAVLEVPMYPNRKYEVGVRHRPSDPENVKSW